MTTVIGQRFLEKPKTQPDRWAIEVEGAAPRSIVDNPSQVYESVNAIFRLRHAYCRENTRPDGTEAEKIHAADHDKVFVYREAEEKPESVGHP